MNTEKPIADNAKLYIVEALCALMKEHAFRDISITSITKKAGVSRMSFYRNFETKEDIISYYIDYMMQAYLKQSPAYEPGTHTFKTYDHIIFSLYFFREYRDFILCLDKENLTGVFLSRINRHIAENVKVPKTDATYHYRLYAYAGAIYNVYIEWIKHDMQVPAENLAHMLYDTYHPYLEGPPACEKQE